MPTASLLVRLSKQADDSNLSLSGMETDQRALAERHGYDVHAVHIDDGISGAVRDRPGFTAWLDDARTGAVDCLIAWSGDRITREGVNAAALVLDVLEGKDTKTGAVRNKPVRFLDCDGLDSQGNPTAFRFAFVIKAEVAREERERIKTRIAAAQRRIRTQVGRHPGRALAFGYCLIDRPEGGKTAVPYEPEAAIIRDAADRILSGVSIYRVVVDMNHSGVPTRKGGIWTIQTLRRILTNPATEGYFVHKGQPIRGDDGHPIQWFEPVLDHDTMEQLRSVVTTPSPFPRLPNGHRAPAKEPGKTEKITRPLSGMVRASCCGAKLYAVNPSPSKPSPLYRQPRQGAGSHSICALQVGINAAPLEAYIESEFLRRFGHLAEVRPVRSSRARVDLAAVERAIHDLSHAMTEAGADIPTLAGQLSALHEQRTELAALPESVETRYEPTGRTIAQAWTSGGVHERNALLREALDGPIRIDAVGHVRVVKTLDLDRVHVAWRGETPETIDYLAGQTD